MSSPVWAFDDARHHFGSDYRGGPYGFGYGRFLLSPYYAYHPRKVEVPREPPVYVQRQNTSYQPQDHKPGIGTIAATRKAIIHMSRSVQMAGCRLPHSQQQLRSNQINL